MADDSEQFCSDRATGHLSDHLSSRDDFPPSPDEFDSTADECNFGGEDVGGGSSSQLQSNWDEGDQRCPDDEKQLDEKKEESDVLDKARVVAGFSELGWSGDGRQKAFCHLDISKHNLREIKILEKYVHLRMIDMSHNKIEDLTVLGNMPYLMDLDASHNKIPVVLGFSPPCNLRYVNLSYNEITEIPDLSMHCRLEHLILDHNKITEISGLDGCCNLTALSLCHNRITEIRCLENLPLKCLMLSCNEILKIDSILCLNMLQELDLAGNRIRSLSGLPCRGHLNSIDLQENEIVDLGEAEKLKHIHYLRCVNLQRNPIEQIPDYRPAVIFTVPQLAVLDMEEITLKERVDAKNLFDPSLEYTAARDHMMHVLYSFLQPAKMLDISLPFSDAPYPMLVLIGPDGVGKRSLAQKLVDEFPNYFGYAALHTTRTPQHGETQLRDYNFMAREEFEDCIKMGTFLLTYVHNDDLYGLSLAAVEAVASESLACVTEMELEGILSLKNSHMQPRSILILPQNIDEFVKLLCGKGLCGVAEIAAAKTRVEMYRSYNRDHPGFFDMTISEDDICETYAALRSVVVKYLGIDESTDVGSSGPSYSLPDNVQDFGGLFTSAGGFMPPARGHSVPAPQRSPWSRPSLHSFRRSKTMKERSQSLFSECRGKSSIEEESLRRRHCEARDALSGVLRCPFQPIAQRISSLGSSNLVCLDDSVPENHHFSAPPTLTNLEVRLPNSPDSSELVSVRESTLSGISYNNAEEDEECTPEENGSARTPEPHRPLWRQNHTSDSSATGSLPALKPSCKTSAEPLDNFCSQPGTGSSEECKSRTPSTGFLPPIGQNCH